MAASVTMIVDSIVIECDIVLVVVVEEQLQQTPFSPIRVCIVFACVVHIVSLVSIIHCLEKFVKRCCFL